jgi:hypothetical protein
MRHQAGIALSYVLAFIALVAIATTYFATTGRGVARSISNQENKVALLEQATLVRSRIIGCAVSFPGGDNGTGFRLPYPPGTTPVAVRDLVCPGQDGANNLWSGTGGLTLPAPPRIFNDWMYVNDASSMRISISAKTSGDATTLAIMDAIATRLGSGASRTGDVLTIVVMN